MVRLVLGILLLIVAVIAAVTTKATKDEETKSGAKVTALATVILGLLLVAFSAVRVVPPGNVGIPVLYGKTQSPVGAGIKLVNPLASITKLSVRTEEYTMSVSHDEGDKKGDDSVTVKGADGATGHVDATLLYHLNESDASRVFKDLGTDYKNKIIRTTARTCIRDGFTQFDMVDAATVKRTQVDDFIKDCISGLIEPRGFTLENFQLRDVSVEKSVQDAIDAKVAAQQNAQKKVFELQAAAQDAEIKRTQAAGIADSQQIITCGATRIDSGNVDENNEAIFIVVPKTGADCEHKLTPEYLQYLYIESLDSIAKSPNNSTIILPFDQKLTPLLNLSPSGQAAG